MAHRRHRRGSRSRRRRALHPGQARSQPQIRRYAARPAGRARRRSSRAPHPPGRADARRLSPDAARPRARRSPRARRAAPSPWRNRARGSSLGPRPHGDGRCPEGRSLARPGTACSPQCHRAEGTPLCPPSRPAPGRPCRSVSSRRPDGLPSPCCRGLRVPPGTHQPPLRGASRAHPRHGASPSRAARRDDARNRGAPSARRHRRRSRNGAPSRYPPPGPAPFPPGAVEHSAPRSARGTARSASGRRRAPCAAPAPLVRAVAQAARRASSWRARLCSRLAPPEVARQAHPRQVRAAPGHGARQAAQADLPVPLPPSRPPARPPSGPGGQAPPVQRRLGGAPRRPLRTLAGGPEGSPEAVRAGPEDLRCPPAGGPPRPGAACPARRTAGKRSAQNAGFLDKLQEEKRGEQRKRPGGGCTRSGRHASASHRRSRRRTPAPACGPAPGTVRPGLGSAPAVLYPSTSTRR